jgi:hypothetical protein
VTFRKRRRRVPKHMGASTTRSTPFASGVASRRTTCSEAGVHHAVTLQPELGRVSLLHFLASRLIICFLSRAYVLCQPTISLPPSCILHFKSGGRLPCSASCLFNIMEIVDAVSSAQNSAPSPCRPTRRLKYATSLVQTNGARRRSGGRLPVPVECGT